MYTYKESGKPSVLPVNLEGIPESLKALPNWVDWKYIWEQWDVERWAKVPINLKTSQYAKPNDPSTWGTFEKAWERYERSKGRLFDGLGFMFSKDDQITGVDLDDCRNPETGVIAPWALEIVEKLDSYTEISPSGKGLHIIVAGVLPPGLRKVGDVEMYDDVHYFTMTGHLLAPGARKAIESRQTELDLLHARFLGGYPDTSVQILSDIAGQQGKASHGSGGWEALLQQLLGAVLTPEDHDIIRQLRLGLYGEMYELLFLGDWGGAGRLRKQGPYKSQSQADLALFNLLARATGGSPTSMYAIFNESGLIMRAKTKDNRTYLARTIKKAIDGMNWRPAQASPREEVLPVMSPLNHEPD
jgi:putative DNA primase/helicase